MTHREKVRFMLEDLEKRGVGRWTSAPPLFRLLWCIGARIPPPYFLPWGRLVLVSGIPFGLGAMAMSILGARLVGAIHPVPGLQSGLETLAWFVGPVGGSFFGACIASWFRKRADALALPPWESYGFDRRAPEVFS